MPDAKCTPGQDGTEADAGFPVSLSPVTGDFGSDEGTITLISNNNQLDEPMDVVGDWLPYMLVAQFHPNSPGDGVKGEEFTIKVRPKDGNTEYVASAVWVTGPEEGGWPPTHGPTMAADSPTGDLQPHQEPLA